MTQPWEAIPVYDDGIIASIINAVTATVDRIAAGDTYDVLALADAIAGLPGVQSCSMDSPLTRVSLLDGTRLARDVDGDMADLGWCHQPEDRRLMTIADAARAAGIAEDQMTRYVQRMPAPAVTVGSGRYATRGWTPGQVRYWDEHRIRKPRRQPS